METTTQRASVRDLLRAKRYYRDNPSGSVRVDWMTSFNRDEFTRWFLRCLHCKINGAEPTQAEREEAFNLRMDARIINDYYGRRIRHSGCSGLLRTLRMQRRYPSINNQERED